MISNDNERRKFRVKSRDELETQRLADFFRKENKSNTSDEFEIQSYR
jgi:hypothetical protein